jgi:hypothetical protein
MPRLENWEISKVSSGYVAYGFIHDDDRWPDDTWIRTSLLKHLDLSKDTVQTLNTLYQLGKRHKNFDIVLRANNETMDSLAHKINQGCSSTG